MKILTNISKETPSQSKLLIPIIEELLNNQELTLKNINEVIAVNGPGSFTGVRLGVTVAKTISYCLNIPLKSISSIDLIALSVEENIDYSVAIKDPKGYYVGEYSQNKTLTGEYFYLSNNEFQNYEINKKVIKNIPIKWNNIYKYNILKNEDCFNMKPLYIKKIEVEKW